MDRHRPRLAAFLTAFLGTPAILLTACGSPAEPGDAPVVTTEATTRATPTPSGYPVARKREVRVAQGQTGTVALSVGDVLAVYRPAMGTRPSGEVLVLAEVTDAELVYQAVSTGRATVATDDPPTPNKPIRKPMPAPTTTTATLSTGES